MYLTPAQTVVMIFAIAIGTAITRFTPFLLFPETRKPPKLIRYLSRFLPPAMMGLLVIYCLKNTSIINAPHGLSEFISIAVIVVLHKLKNNVFLSIIGGTAVYMVLIRTVFT